MAGLYARLDAERARVKDRYRRGAAGPDRRPERRHAGGARRRGARAGQADEAAGRRRQRAVLRAAGQHLRRAPRTSAGSASSTRTTSTNRCCSTGGRPRPARLLRRHRRASRRTCVGAASSTPAGAASSISPTRCSAVPAPTSVAAGVTRRCSRPSTRRAVTGMRDIVATIQAEQDEIIRLDHPGVLVIEGGPGTGKTVVALHRVAYLLYTQRERMERHGVLVVGPNPAFLNHIGRVLPSLGESDVVFMTDRRPRARPARHRRGHPGGRAAQGLADDPRRARGGDRRPAAAAGAAAADRAGGRHGAHRRRDRASGPARRPARAGSRTTRPARCSSRSSPTCSPNGRSPGSAGAG